MPVATAPHSAVIDQDMLANMQKGLRYIEREFGQDARPRVAWSIDPFGHSSTYATLNALFGFDFFVVGRIDFQEKAARFATKSMETVWRVLLSRGWFGPWRIFTHCIGPVGPCSLPRGATGSSTYASFFFCFFLFGMR